MEFVKCLGHPEEFYNLVRFRIGGKRKVMPKMDQITSHEGRFWNEV
ncbi:FDFT1 isoform 10 [Pan troglodytes]|uniref:Farnesyl-diphosphate farnesyltransferase 1 n=2 Tax=Homininae TaxID=207598 RepID=E9PQ90_HUMAN|nr:FDFT1 isoform 10 [Pan troglodytes]